MIFTRKIHNYHLKKEKKKNCQHEDNIQKNFMFIQKFQRFKLKIMPNMNYSFTELPLNKTFKCFLKDDIVVIRLIFSGSPFQTLQLL